VKLLFRGHRELILGFNTFLPKVRALCAFGLSSRTLSQPAFACPCRGLPLVLRSATPSLCPAAAFVCRLQGYEIQLTEEEMEPPAKVRAAQCTGLARARPSPELTRPLVRRSPSSRWSLTRPSAT